MKNSPAGGGAEYAAKVHTRPDTRKAAVPTGTPRADTDQPPNVPLGRTKEGKEPAAAADSHPARTRKRPPRAADRTHAAQGRSRAGTEEGEPAEDRATASVKRRGTDSQQGVRPKEAYRATGQEPEAVPRGAAGGKPTASTTGYKGPYRVPRPYGRSAGGYASRHPTRWARQQETGSRHPAVPRCHLDAPCGGFIPGTAWFGSRAPAMVGLSDRPR